jgi:hypothetical protein
VRQISRQRRAAQTPPQPALQPGMMLTIQPLNATQLNYLHEHNSNLK